MAWTRATHLNQWADTELAPRHLPLLVRKLIRKTIPELTKLNIPANEQTVRPGFDGIVECSVGNQYVPSGKSVWEMGADLDPKKKANGDIQKRTAELSDAQRAETSFVFVTPRPWLKKDEWAKNMARDGGWKAVAVHDSNDLEHWLDLARDVDAWISHETRQAPAGVQCLEQHWESLRNIAEHSLLPAVFTAARDTEIDRVAQFLSRTPNSLFIQTPSLSDGIDFLAALAAEQSEKFRQGDPDIEPQSLTLFQNALIVFSLDDWRQLASSDGPILLIASPGLQISSTDISRAVKAGHFVVVSGPRGIVPPDKGIVLRGVQQYELEKALEASGYSDSQANSHAKACAGNTTILKRRIATHPDTILPKWAEPAAAQDLAFLALVGGWAHLDPKPPIQKDIPEFVRYIPPVDLTILELVGYSRSTLDRLIGQWQEWPDPFFLRFGDTVLVTSREDAWHLIGDYITNDQLKQFSDLGILVLEEDNPALELEPDQRWMANFLGKQHSLSGELRKSLIETMAIMATCPTVKHPSPGNRFAETIERILNAAWPKKCDWKRWASLRSHFGILAEASPELFLSRIEEDLKSTEPAMLNLFREQTGAIMGGWMHCELLWALESLAWSPEYLSRVSVILAKLCSQISLPTNYGNSPTISLHEIFLLWLPHTNATVEGRIVAIKQVLNAEPDVGWRLLLGLLPQGNTTFAHNGSMPRWRPWADGWSRESVDRERYIYAMALANLAFEVMGENSGRWAEALEGMLRFNDEVSQRVFVSLHVIAEAFDGNPDDAFELWDALRSTIQSHEDFADAKWALPTKTIHELSRIRDQLIPVDPVLSNRWLFNAHAEMPGYRKCKDYKEREAELEEARTRAIRDILDASGSDGLWRLLELNVAGHAIGYISGKHGLVTEQEARLPKSLLDMDESIAAFAARYVVASYYHRGEWAWVNSLNLLEWSSDEKIALATRLPFDPKVWDWVETQELEVQEEYWKVVGAYLPKWDEQTVRRAVAGLLTVGRPFTAIDLVHFHGETNVSSELIAEVLEAGLTLEASEKMGDIGYDIRQLIGCLQADASFDRERLAGLEWGYLPVLDKEISETEPRTLIAAALESPSFYLELIQAAYDSNNTRLLARRAIELLDLLDTLPGMDEHGNIDIAILDEWVCSAIELSEQSGHFEITAHKIGQFMGRAIYPYLDKVEILSQLGGVIESRGNTDLTSGLINGILNSRGVTSRGPFDGGKLEHDLAAKFGERAKFLTGSSPKLAKCFAIIQLRYEHDGRREDEEAERLRTGR